MGLPSDQEVDQRRKVVNDLVSVSWPQSLPGVKRAQSTWTGARVLVEGLERSNYVVCFSCWHKADIWGTQAREVRVVVRRRVLTKHLIENIIWVDGGWGVESFAGFGVSPLPAKIFAPLEPACFGKLRGSVRVLVLAWGLVLGYVLPK